MKYVYPAVFTFDKTDENFPNGIYLVEFPDLDGCYTFGETLEKAYEMAEDVLNLTLWDLEEEKAEIPVPTNLKDIKCDENSFASLVSADTLTYRKLHDTKAVKKTLSIPRWLDTIAQERGVNFSNILQQALMKELNVTAPKHA